MQMCLDNDTLVNRAFHMFAGQAYKYFNLLLTVDVSKNNHVWSNHVWCNSFTVFSQMNVDVAKFFCWRYVLWLQLTFLLVSISSGQLPEEAEMNYLENAKTIALYGTHMHPATMIVKVMRLLMC